MSVTNKSSVPHNDDFALDETQKRTPILIPGDVPKGWSNPQMLGYRNDVEGKQCFEELKTAIAFLSEQGCGDPHFIPVFGVLKLTRKQMREGLEILDGSMMEKREFLNSMKWGMTGEPNVHMNRDIDVLGAGVVGAHAVFDYSEPVSQETFATRPYLRVDIRLDIPLECQVDEEDGETHRGWNGSVRVDIPSSVLFPELKEIAA